MRTPVHQLYCTKNKIQDVSKDVSSKCGQSANNYEFFKINKNVFFLRTFLSGFSAVRPKLNHLKSKDNLKIAFKGSVKMQSFV